MTSFAGRGSKVISPLASRLWGAYHVHIILQYNTTLDRYFPDWPPVHLQAEQFDKIRLLRRSRFFAEPRYFCRCDVSIKLRTLILDLPGRLFGLIGAELSCLSSQSTKI